MLFEARNLARPNECAYWVVFNTRDNVPTFYTRTEREAKRLAQWVNGTHTFSGHPLTATTK